jgi:D-alanine-D-alanine ligase
MVTHRPADLPVVLLYNSDPAWTQSDADEMTSLAKTLAEGLIAAGHPTQTVCLQDQSLHQVMAEYDPASQVVFNWCEEIPGIPRSSSLVARGLEDLGFTFTGADSSALLFSQDKPAVKQRLASKNIPTPAWRICEPGQESGWDCFPAIVKPAYEHCSIGINHDAVVRSPGELTRRIEQVVTEHCQPVIVEDFIEGRELHVGVFGNGRLRTLPPAEMDFSAIPEQSRHLCTYDSKFTPASSDYQNIQLRLPADLGSDEQKQLEAISIAAYRAADCRDYARLDIRQRDGTFYVLDINPNADISPDTSLTLSAELAGYSFGQFGSLLVGLAARRHPLLGRRDTGH